MLFPMDEGWVTAMTIRILGGEVLLRGILSLFRAHLSLAASCRVPSPCQLQPSHRPTSRHSSRRLHILLATLTLTLTLPPSDPPPCLASAGGDRLPSSGALSRLAQVHRYLLCRRGEPAAPRPPVPPRRHPGERGPPSAVLAGTPLDLQGRLVRRRHRARHEQPQHGSGCGCQAPVGLAQPLLGVPWRAEQGV